MKAGTTAGAPAAWRRHVPPAVVGVLGVAMYVWYASHKMVGGSRRVGEPPGAYTRAELNGIIMFHVSYGLMVWSFVQTVRIAPGVVPDRYPWTIIESANDDDDEDGAAAASRFQFNAAQRRLMTAIMSPDYWPDQSGDDRDAIRRLPFVELKNSRANAVRRCVKCHPQRFKPDRAHHCSKAGRCILKMDHFCTFANTTIGYGNQKAFVLFLAYALSSCIIALADLADQFGACADGLAGGADRWRAVVRDLVVVVAYLSCLFVTIALALFATFHLYLVLNNQTTIEFREKHGSAHAEVRRRSHVAALKFDAGYWTNFRDVFGANPAAWFVPIDLGRRRPADDHEGLYVTPQELERLTASAPFATNLP